MLDSEIKISAEFEPLPTRRARLIAWFWRPGSGRWFRRLRWGRVALLPTVLVLAGYLGFVTALFCFVRFHRKVENVRWMDIALPWRRPAFDLARGEHQLAVAKKLVAEGKYSEALMYARAGLSRAPANGEGRLLLVELEQAARRPEIARRTLVDGLTYHHHDPGYVKRVLARLLQEQKDAAVVFLAQRYGPKLPGDSEAGRLFTLGAATAAYFRGNYDRAEDLLRHSPTLADSRDGRLLATKIEWARGYPDLALVRLRQLAGELPGDPEVHREVVSHLRMRGLTEEARRRNLAFQIAHPKLVWPRSEMMRAYREAGEADRLAREVNAFLTDFADDQDALLALADFASETGDVALAERVLAHGASRNWLREPFAFLAVETKITAGHYAAALEQLNSYRRERVEWERRHPALFASLQAIASWGAGEIAAARGYLAEFLAREDVRAENLVAVANRLVALDAVEEAARVLAKALRRDPNNQAALTRLVEVDIVLNRGDDLAQHVQQLLNMRRPSPELLQVAQLKLGSDLFLFSRDVPAAVDAIGAFLETTRSRRSRAAP